MVDQTEDDEVGQHEPPAETDLRQLIIRAFAAANAAGKPNDMTIAVLKNRLLDLTEREFSEGNYGYSSMSDLARGLPDLLDLDETTRPPRVRLRTDASTAEAYDYTEFQVRGDLWKAMLDYSRDEPYIWSAGTAVPASEVDEPDAGPTLPTATLEDETAWRIEFQEHTSPTLRQDLKELVQYWIDRHQTPKVLPGFLQRQWNVELKNHVIQRLFEWFSEQQIPQPSDLLIPFRKPPAKAPDRLAELRALVIRCVQNMTEEELSELRLPPQTLLRGQK